MYAPLEQTDVSTVGLSGSNLIVSTQIREKSTSAAGELSLVPGTLVLPVLDTKHLMLSVTQFIILMEALKI